MASKRGPVLDRLPYKSVLDTVGTFLICFLVAAGIVHYVRDNTESWQWSHTYWTLSVGAGVYLLITHKMWGKKGTWHFDEEGIKFEPLIDEPLFLRWDEIESVSWGKNIGLSQGKQKLWVMLSILEKQEREPVKKYLQEKLENHFDLTDYDSKELNSKVRARNLTQYILLPMLIGFAWESAKHHYSKILAFLILVALCFLQNNLFGITTWRERGVIYGEQQKAS